MTIALGLLKRFWLPLLVAALLFFGAQGAYRAGEASKDAEWAARWNAHQYDDATKTAQAQADQRDLEQKRQADIDKVTTDAQTQIDQANADAAGAAALADSVQHAAGRLAGRLADSQARVSACTTDASKAAAENARVLADVLKRADQRAGHLAGVADQAMTRGLACEAAYDAVRGDRQ
ncbi:hypothetical protein [Pseudomonas phage PPpW-3]|uniref:DUF2514 domain-containing protein n=1 Tax=Pseudomonas phage PPpW-3 TaxID=1279082 RepID=V5YUT3_9CAUD|nr:Rz-like spanin [Pseudomonas phage PPpW-3]BAO20666.1 hypothetical protein [Pseudomonas phage PPpW-3]